jgi:hypothetical protein
MPKTAITIPKEVITMARNERSRCAVIGDHDGPKHADALMLFLEEPLLAPDNNATERSIRSVVIGKKNHYGSSSTRGTQVAAVFYSLLESAHLAGVNPHDYLRAAVHAALGGKPVPMPHEFS